MRKMKKSGLEWIGDIPGNSEITRLKYIGDVFGRIGFRGYTQADLVPEGEGPITLSPSNINEFGMDYSKCTYLSWDKYDESPEIQIKNGDVLMVKTGSSYGKSAIVEELPMEATINPQFVVIKNIRCNPKYLYYYMQTELFKYQVEEAVVGGTIPTMAQEKINAFYIINYKEKYCRRIVEFLDKKCAEIDALIDAKEKTNSLLKEQRQSIIYEAVTKGLNSDVPMKDSGIEWIGDVPETWDVKKIKYCFDLVAGATPKSSNSEYWDGNIVWITPADYKTEDVFIEKGHKNITDEGMQSCATTLIPENCIIFSKRAPVGLVAINRVPLCTNQGCISCIPHNDISSKFYYYVMSVFEEQFELFASGTTFKEISADSFANFLLPNTTFDEQVEIVNYLDEKCAELDTIIKSNRTIIEKLKEYRKSIIFEAVTGKVEI